MAKHSTIIIPVFIVSFIVSGAQETFIIINVENICAP